jgi:hypothetical protein
VDPHIPKQRLSAGAGEVRVYPFFKTHVADHRQILSSS